MSTQLPPLPWGNSIREINRRPDDEKHAIYRTLLPDWIYETYGIDTETLSVDGYRVVRFRCPSGSRAIEIAVYRKATDRDPALYLNMADTFNNQLLVLLVVMNNPDGPRFNIDIDEHGNSTQLGTTGRNLAAEEAAMRYGLAPGQIRPGLRSFRHALPLFEQFVQNLDHDMFLIEPLAYHNAIVFERYGFNYMRGHREMIRINQEFQPGGELFGKLSTDRIFRPVEAWRNVRGRSWAIHDGVLGHPFTGFQMYKRVGVHAGLNTFPHAIW
ncbi:MAG: hypothetical protein K8I60_17350 [Anaerolineae bacterium]|nr:hypothetical protein [Anaerolineae bacterium]